MFSRVAQDGGSLSALVEIICVERKANALSMVL